MQRFGEYDTYETSPQTAKLYGKDSEKRAPASHIKVGQFVTHEKSNRPCKVITVKTSKTGKHGHAKCTFIVKDIFTGKKYAILAPGEKSLSVPSISRKEWEIVCIKDDGLFVDLRNPDDYSEISNDVCLSTTPASLVSEIKEVWDEYVETDTHTVRVIVQKALGIEQVISYRNVKHV